MQKYIADNFAKSELLREMQPVFLESLASIAVERQAQNGEILFLQHQEAMGFYLICSGKLKVYRLGADGREQVIHNFGEGEIVGEVPVFQGTAYPACAMAVSDVELIYFSRSSFVTLGRQQPEIFLNMLAILSRRLRHFVELVDDLSLKDVTSRLAKFLVSISIDENSNALTLTLSKTALASRLGTIPATLSRTFKKLQDIRIIKVAGSKITIIDSEKLLDLANGAKIDELL